MITGKAFGKKGICVNRFVMILLSLILLCSASAAEGYLRQWQEFLSL